MQKLSTLITNWLNPSSALQTITTSQPVQSPNQNTNHTLLPQPTTNNTSTTAFRKVKLIMVTENNNNKFYEMTENDNGTFTVAYGRVGSSKTEVTYSMAEWQTKYNEKIRKGYTDQTHLFALKTADTDASSIDNLAVRKLMEGFMQYARKSILSNYTVLATDVTEKQVAEAQALVNELIGKIKKGMDIQYFNQQLLSLFKVIPRKMANVKENLLHDSPKTNDEIQKIKDQIVHEQATLDVMKSQVEINQKQNTQPDEKRNLLELMGIKVDKVEDPKVEKLIKLMMGDCSQKFVEAYQVNNLSTQHKYENWMSNTANKKTQLLWHGSRNENWLSILKSGLVLRPVNAIITGKMFGYGTYFANEFSKSLNYSSLQGSVWTNGNSNEAYLAIFEVHTGNQLEISQHEGWHSQLNENKLKSLNKNYDSVFAKRGVSLRNNEFIVYNENQCTIKYIVKIR